MHSVWLETSYLVSNGVFRCLQAVLIANNLLLGQWEFVKKGEPPVVGITKLVDGVTLEELKRPRRKVDASELHPVPSPSTTLEAEKPMDSTP